MISSLSILPTIFKRIFRIAVIFSLVSAFICRYLLTLQLFAPREAGTR